MDILCHNCALWQHMRAHGQHLLLQLEHAAVPVIALSTCLDGLLGQQFPSAQSRPKPQTGVSSRRTDVVGDACGALVTLSRCRWRRAWHGACSAYGRARKELCTRLHMTRSCVCTGPSASAPPHHNHPLPRPANYDGYGNVAHGLRGTGGWPASSTNHPVQVRGLYRFKRVRHEFGGWPWIPCLKQITSFEDTCARTASLRLLGLIWFSRDGCGYGVEGVVHCPGDALQDARRQRRSVGPSLSSARACFQKHAKAPCQHQRNHRLQVVAGAAGQSMQQQHAVKVCLRRELALWIMFLELVVTEPNDQQSSDDLAPKHLMCHGVEIQQVRVDANAEGGEQNASQPISHSLLVTLRASQQCSPYVYQNQRHHGVSSEAQAIITVGYMDHPRPLVCKSREHCTLYPVVFSG
eukprot:CAMPEP_0114233706 /NCGR_PEP_ID=MMETSP0058-20121206/5319_1 /TAXON_ID=36894 /ORGANISM="Pyramimonas parkeae, CCMP726" /LENGTH=407 /DNA_ID=CAMNT_0001345337 /DNA_START=498 /DNA_END=1721 /DNA_ORIENTATION=+